MPLLNAIKRRQSNLPCPHARWSPSKSSHRFYIHDSSLQNLSCLFPSVSCLTMCPRFCSSEQFLLSCLAQTSGLLLTTDIIALWITMFFVKYKVEGTRATINRTVPQLGTLVRAKIISRCLSIARYKVRDNDHFSYHYIFFFVRLKK